MNDLDPELLSKCIIEQDDGILINIEVKPGASTTGIEGIDEWRDCINVKLKAKAEKGKANKELIQLFSSMLALPTSTIVIVGGKKSRRKNIKIFGLKAEEVARRLKG
ncbi:MAG: YggU family protein [Candidatus Aminicenantes bacterium]|nr:MAG: YggU family protein [Candidatus Aminicenantes bacterium]